MSLFDCSYARVSEEDIFVTYTGAIKDLKYHGEGLLEIIDRETTSKKTKFKGNFE